MDSNTATTAPVEPTTQQATTGLIDNKDVDRWKEKFSELLAKPAEHIQSKSPETAREWHAGLFSCFSPIDTCTSAVNWRGQRSLTTLTHQACSERAAPASFSAVFTTVCTRTARSRATTGSTRPACSRSLPSVFPCCR